MKHKLKKFKIKHNILIIQTHPENSKSNTTYSQYKHTQKIQNQTQTQKIQYQTQTQKVDGGVAWLIAWLQVIMLEMKKKRKKERCTYSSI